MPDRTYTIGELCAEFDVTPRALRFYEYKELLSPIREGQKRLFTHADRARLILILRGKRFGFSLAEIRSFSISTRMGDGRVTQLDRHAEMRQSGTSGRASCQRDDRAESPTEAHHRPNDGSMLAVRR